MSSSFYILLRCRCVFLLFYNFFSTSFVVYYFFTEFKCIFLLFFFIEIPILFLAWSFSQVVVLTLLRLGGAIFLSRSLFTIVWNPFLDRKSGLGRKFKYRSSFRRLFLYSLNMNLLLLFIFLFICCFMYFISSSFSTLFNFSVIKKTSTVNWNQ